MEWRPQCWQCCVLQQHAVPAAATEIAAATISEWHPCLINARQGCSEGEVAFVWFSCIFTHWRNFSQLNISQMICCHRHSTHVPEVDFCNWVQVERFKFCISCGPPVHPPAIPRSSAARGTSEAVTHKMCMSQLPQQWLPRWLFHFRLPMCWQTPPHTHTTHTPHTRLFTYWTFWGSRTHT